MSKKIILLILSLCLWIGIHMEYEVKASVISSNALKENGDYQYYVLDGTYISLVHYIGKSDIVTIPNEIEQKKVIKISRKCFEDNEYVKEVTIPNGVTFIDDAVFAGCSRLTRVSIPDSVRYIGYGVFNDSGIESLRMPKGILSLDHAFVEGCQNLRELIITNLETLDELENGLYYGCPKLKEFKVEIKESPFFTVDGALFQRKREDNEGVADNETVMLIAYPQGKKDKTYYVPQGVEEVRDGAFWECEYLQKIVLSENVRKFRLEMSSKKPLTVVVLSSITNLFSTYYEDRLGYYADTEIRIHTVKENTGVQMFSKNQHIPFKIISKKKYIKKSQSKTVEGLGVSLRDKNMAEYWETIYPALVENIDDYSQTEVEVFSNQGFDISSEENEVNESQREDINEANDVDANGGTGNESKGNEGEGRDLSKESNGEKEKNPIKWIYICLPIAIVGIIFTSVVLFKKSRR